MGSFSEDLVRARKAAGMTQEDVASAVHVARNTVSSWERGHRTPDLETVRQLSRLLNFDFLTGEDRPVPGEIQPAGEAQTAVEPQTGGEIQPAGEAQLPEKRGPDARPDRPGAAKKGPGG